MDFLLSIVSEIYQFELFVKIFKNILLSHFHIRIMHTYTNVKVDLEVFDKICWYRLFFLVKNIKSRVTI